MRTTNQTTGCGNMIEKIPLLNSKHKSVKLIGIFIYGILLLFAIALYGSTLNHENTSTKNTTTNIDDLIKVDLGAYMVSFKVPWSGTSWAYDPEIDPLSCGYYSAYTGSPAYNYCNRRMAAKDDWNKMMITYIYDFDEPQFNKTEAEHTLRDHLKLGHKYSLLESSTFTSTHEYVVVEDDYRVGAGCWLDENTMFTIEGNAFNRGDFEFMLGTLNINEKAGSGS